MRRTPFVPTVLAMVTLGLTYPGAVDLPAGEHFTLNRPGQGGLGTGDKSGGSATFTTCLEDEGETLRSTGNVFVARVAGQSPQRGRQPRDARRLLRLRQGRRLRARADLRRREQGLLLAVRQRRPAPRAVALLPHAGRHQRRLPPA